MSDHGQHHSAALPAGALLTPQAVRTRTFGRTPLGRRGLDEDEVHDFLDQLADELVHRDQREAAMRANAERHKQALRAWSREQAASRGHGPVEEARPPDRPSVDAVTLMARTQQDCDQHIRRTEDYCRRLAAEAERYAGEVLAEAQHRAAEAADAAASAYRSGGGEDCSTDSQELQLRLTWMSTFIESLGAAQAQLGATRDALRHDIDRLQGLGDR